MITALPSSDGMVGYLVVAVVAALSMLTGIVAYVIGREHADQECEALRKELARMRRVS